nr:Probable extracellular nuclease [Kibdelosporangium sp. MJ126-NF4]
MKVIMRYNRTILALGGVAILTTGAAVLLPAAAQAQIASVPCDETALVNAVTAANAAGGGTVTLTPGCTYTLTTEHGNDGVNGPAGLPIITTPITLEGNANTIARATNALAFRIAQVGPTGGITLKAVTFSGGNAAMAGHNDGGGILNFGAVTLTGSELSGNTAGGSGGALYSTGTPAAATFTSSTVKSNTANQGAGIASVNGTLTLTSSVVNTNAANVNPGGIYYVAGSASLNTTTVTANTPTNCVSSPSPVPGCIG